MLSQSGNQYGVASSSGDESQRRTSERADMQPSAVLGRSTHRMQKECFPFPGDMPVCVCMGTCFHADMTQPDRRQIPDLRGPYHCSPGSANFVDEAILSPACLLVYLTAKSVDEVHHWGGEMWNPSKQQKDLRVFFGGTTHRYQTSLSFTHRHLISFDERFSELFSPCDLRHDLRGKVYEMTFSPPSSPNGAESRDVQPYPRVLSAVPRVRGTREEDASSRKPCSNSTTCS